MTSSVLTLDATSAGSFRDRIRPVYAEAFGAIDDPGAWDRDVFDRHRARPGYRLVVAIDGDEVVGFAWGYTGLAGQPFADLIARSLGDHAQDWTPGHFEFVELAVSAAARGRGLGRGLHDALLDGLPHRQALLLTDDAETPAVALYRSAGWRRLAEFRPGTQVMGVRVAGRQPSARRDREADAGVMSDSTDDLPTTDGMPARDAHLHEDPITQGETPLEAELGTDGSGDLAPEDDPLVDEHADDGPTDLRDHL